MAVAYYFKRHKIAIIYINLDIRKNAGIHCCNTAKQILQPSVDTAYLIPTLLIYDTFVIIISKYMFLGKVPFVASINFSPHQKYAIRLHSYCSVGLLKAQNCLLQVYRKNLDTFVQRTRTQSYSS